MFGAHARKVSAGAAVGAVACVWSCGPVDPRVPGASGTTDDAAMWVVFDATVPDRDPRDLVASFEESARARGCSTEVLGRRWRHHYGGTAEAQANFYTGVEARCDEGVIRLGPLQDGVRVACAKPTTADRCNTLLRAITDAR